MKIRLSAVVLLRIAVACMAGRALGALKQDEDTSLTTGSDQGQVSCLGVELNDGKPSIAPVWIFWKCDGVFSIQSDARCDESAAGWVYPRHRHIKRSDFGITYAGGAISDELELTLAVEVIK